MLFAPELQAGGNELGAVVQSDDAGFAPPLADAFKCFDHPSRGKGSIDFDIEQFPVELIDNVEQAVAPAVPQCVTHEVHRPDMVRHLQRFQRRLDPFGKPLLRLSADVEPELSVNVVDPLVVPLVSGVADTQKQLSKPVSWMLPGKVVQDIDDLLIVTLLGLIVKCTAVAVHDCTRLTDTQIVLCPQIRD